MKQIFLNNHAILDKELKASIIVDISQHTLCNHQVSFGCQQEDQDPPHPSNTHHFLLRDVRASVSVTTNQFERLNTTKNVKRRHSFTLTLITGYLHCIAVSGQSCRLSHIGQNCASLLFTPFESSQITSSFSYQ